MNLQEYGLVEERPPVSSPEDREALLRRRDEAAGYEASLGYGWLRAQLDKKLKPKPLAEALRKLEFLVLEPESVRRYKERVEEESATRFEALQSEVQTAEARMKRLDKEKSAEGGGLMVALTGAFLPGGAVTLICLVVGFCTAYWWPALAAALWTIVFFGAMLWRLNWLEAQTSEERKAQQKEAFLKRAPESVELSWDSSPLDKYEEEVPARALWKALELRKLIPDVAFDVEFSTVVDEVNFDEEAWHYRPDPFLVARLEDECYYLEVWNEKDYDPVLED